MYVGQQYCFCLLVVYGCCLGDIFVIVGYFEVNQVWQWVGIDVDIYYLYSGFGLCCQYVDVGVVLYYIVCMNGCYYLW